nr:PREDICTED: uncharacterized protein LOC107078202 [Lepisosteus oculatus]
MFSTMPCACVILLFLLGMHLCSSQSPEQHVKGTLGQNFLFQTSVSGSGNLIRGVSTLAKVTGGVLVFSDNSGRVSWDKQTGFFQIKDLKTSDGDIYTVEIPNGQSAKYILVVYHPVSLPQVRVISRGGTCFLECSVKNGREVTLLLKSSGKTLIHTVDPDLNTRLILHRVTEGLSHSYSCVASNPVSNESVPVQPDQFCGGESVSSPSTLTLSFHCLHYTCSIGRLGEVRVQIPDSSKSPVNNYCLLLVYY